MKPLHVGLLVFGAALAGGLAVKMSQPPPIPVAPNPVSVPAVPPLPQRATIVKADPIPLPAKPSPFLETVASAPPPVYEEPVQPPIRKNKPILVAKALPEPQQVPQLKPPVPYVPVPAPVAAAPSALEPQAQQQPPPRPQSEPAPRQVTLRTGIPISVRLNESLSSDRSVSGDTFSASLAEPLVVDGLVIAERGARVTGRIVAAQKGGRLSGTSLVELELTSLFSADGQKVAISTDPWTKRGDSSRNEDAAKIGGGAALGAIIGAIAGGGAGAAIGAGIGGGAGIGTVAVTRAKPVNVPSETIIRFRLATKITISERQL